MIIVDPAQCTDHFDTVAEHVQGILRKNGADIKRFSKWDDRRLAYPIKKQTRGVYLLIYFQAPPESIVQINRDYELSETVLRSLITLPEKEAAEVILSGGTPPVPGEAPAVEASSPRPEPKPRTDDDSDGEDERRERRSRSDDN
jgi:small subunit ribosomal protein S6